MVPALVLSLALSSCATSSADRWVEVGAAETVTEQGIVYLPEARVYVVATDDGFIGLTDGAQHLDDERVLYCGPWGGFIGPHGEGFDRLGRYRFGPARSDMDRVATRVVDDMVGVDPSAVTVVPDRSEGAPASVGMEACDGSEAPAGFVDTG